MSTPAPPNIPKLPSWTDPGSVATFLVAAATFVFGILAEFHVSLPNGTPAAVQQVVPWAAMLISTVAVLVLKHIHTTAHAKVLLQHPEHVPPAAEFQRWMTVPAPAQWSPPATAGPHLNPTPTINQGASAS